MTRTVSRAPTRALAGALLLAIAAPAAADVRAGVDAYKRGDFAAALREWRPLADRGDADAQFNLAQAYKLGRGVPANLDTALGLYRKAALQNHGEAQALLGLLLFQNGKRAEAMPWLGKAADRGDPASQYVYGTALFNGDMVERDWPRGLPEGLIHADLFPDNVLFVSRHLSGLIDFYFACTDALAFDLAVCLNAWCFEPDKSFNATKGRALLQGYERVRPLDADERKGLPLLARGSALRFLLTRLYDWVHTPPDALVKRKDPQEYLAKMRFHRGIASIADYGL